MWRTAISFVVPALLVVELLAPGKAFGAGGEGWLRMCFAKEPARLEEAIALIGDFLGTR